MDLKEVIECLLDASGPYLSLMLPTMQLEARALAMNPESPDRSKLLTLWLMPEEEFLENLKHMLGSNKSVAKILGSKDPEFWRR